MHKLLGRIWNPVYTATGNDNDSYNPEVWAQESLMILENNMVAANLVYRDFEDELQSYGDIVNTRRPSSFTAKRKTDDDDVTDQAAISTNVPVPLDQFFHTSFVIKDREMSWAFKNLAEVYLVPAAISIAQGLDEVVTLQVYQFLANGVGKLGTNPTRDTLIELKEKMSNNMCPLAGRRLLLNPNLEGALLAADDGFTDAEKVGDNGTAMREAILGRKMGFDTYMDQNTPSVISAPTAQGAINYASGYGVGTTSIACNGSVTVVAGQWITIAGDNTPQRVVSFTGAGPNTTAMVISPGLRNAVGHTAVISAYDQGEVDCVANYVSGWAKAIVTDGFSPAPVKGQLVSAEDAVASYYGLMTGSTATALYLDRPIDTGWEDNDDLFLGPQGNYGFAFHRNALALVTRPLATPPSQTGARSAIANYNGLSIRVTMTYDGKAQGLRVTLDVLCGVKVLDVNLGAVLFG